MADSPKKGKTADLDAASKTSEFSGSYQHSLDAKGRISLPSAFRQVLELRGERTVVLTNFVCDGARCLDGYAIGDWQVFEAALRKRSRFDPQLRTLENYYLARATHLEVDASGRINVPTQLRTYAGLDKEVSFTSAMHGFRMWDRRVWELVFGQAETALLENPALFIDVDRE